MIAGKSYHIMKKKNVLRVNVSCRMWIWCDKVFKCTILWST